MATTTDTTTPQDRRAARRSQTPAQEASKPRGAQTPEHKAALAEGRVQSRAVSNYLDALEASHTGPGRKRNPDKVRERLDAISHELGDASGLQRLTLLQEQETLTEALAALESTSNGAELEALEQAFVQVAAPYGTRKGISYRTWRAAGVPAATLKAAGISKA